MVGREVAALARTPAPLQPSARVVLRAEGLTNERITDVSLEVREGEILGLAGLVGSGRSETLRAIFGADRVRSGTIAIDGVRVRRRSIRRMIERGLALVPESRKDEGLVLGRDTAENIALPSLGRRQVAGVVRRGHERAAVDRVVTTVDVRGNVRHGTGASGGVGGGRGAIGRMWGRGRGRVPEARKDGGLVLGRDTAENVALPALGRRQGAGVVRRGSERAAVDRVVTTVDVRGNVRHVPVGARSGGNQQKALFGKWLVEPPRVFLIDEPTRGVDINAKVNIHNMILALPAAGTAVIVLSSQPTSDDRRVGKKGV